MGYPINWAPAEPNTPHATPGTERYVILIEHWRSDDDAEWSASDHGFTEWHDARGYLEYLSWRPGLHLDSYTDDSISGIGRMAILDLRSGEVHMMVDVLGHDFQHAWGFAVEEKPLRCLKRERGIPVPKYIEFPVEGDGIGAIWGREEGRRRGLKEYREPEPDPPPRQAGAGAPRVKVTWRMP